MPKRFSKDELRQMSLELIEKHKLFFVQDVTDMLPVTRKTFYHKKLHECDILNNALIKNKIEVKTSLRAKWYASDNPTTQIALYKLIGTDEEFIKLSNGRMELSGKDGAPLNLVININPDDLKSDPIE